MPSAFSWLDHSDRERRRVLDAIDKLKETETRDELGLGAIRDGFADLFFPGISTIQTRARYFLLVPWGCKAVEQKNLSEGFAKKLRVEETKLVDGLKEGIDEGVIGRRSGASTQRMASSIYWFGLASWGIRRFRGSLQDYYRSNENGDRGRGELRDDDDNVIDEKAGYWHAYLPDPPDEFPGEASLELTIAEAEYLKERIHFSVPHSLLAFLVRQARSLEGEFAWQHPQLADFPEPVADALSHAQCFAEGMQSASLVYNLMLAEEMQPGELRNTRIEDFRARLAVLRTDLEPRQRALQEWDRDAFWQLVDEIATVRYPTRLFVNAWLDLKPWTRPADFIDAPAIRALIRDRELALKGKGRARLGNPRAIENWSGEAGTAMLEYRWNAAQRIVSDILSVEA